MEKPILVMGHLNPDTDAICSAVAYAYFKQQIGAKNVVAARCGKINPETEFVLNYFNVQAPLLVNDLYPHLRDINLKKVPTVLPEATLREVGLVLAGEGLRAVPVVESNGKLAGMITLKDIALRDYEDIVGRKVRPADIAFETIAEVLAGKLVQGDGKRIFAGNVRIGVSTAATLSEKVRKDDLVIIGDRVEGQIAALRAGAELIVVTERPIDEAVRELAEKEGAVLISTGCDAYTAARLISLCASVKSLMTTEVVSFSQDDLLSDAREKMATTGHICYPVLKKGKYVGVVDQKGLIFPPEREIILVDHNERSQAVEGIDEATVVEIVDHHRLGGLMTKAPLGIIMEPVGSTCSIVAKLFFEREIELPAEIAGILLSAIISDTLYFRSPTTTSLEKELGPKLAKIAGISDLEFFAMELLRQGSVIETLTPKELVNNDIKEFVIGERKLAVGQINIMGRESAKGKLVVLTKALEDYRKSGNYHFALLMVTDIIGESTDLLVVGEPQELFEQAFGKKNADGVYYLPGCLSRKKQIVPVITDMFH